MKTLLISAIILGFVTGGYAQGNSNRLNLKIKKENPKTASINSNYLSKVSKGTVSFRVLELQNSVADFNLLKSPLFKGNGKNYLVSFGKTNGKIYVTFDDHGKVIYSIGQFRNVVFPKPVQRIIYKTYPGWYVLSNSYNSNYSNNGDVENIYKVKIGKGQLQKRLKINEQGKIL